MTPRAAPPSPAETSPQPVCPSAAVQDGGLAQVFDLLEYGQPVRAFVVRFQGQVAGYINRCAHVPAELDWQPGKVFDDEGRWLLCSIHGAMYEPLSGECVAGPCRRGRLKPIDVREEDGQVCWYPSQHLQPVIASASAATGL